MRAKTIFIIILTVLVTVILMKNTDEVVFWLFGDRFVPKLAILGTMFASGLIVGLLIGRPRRKALKENSLEQETQGNVPNTTELTDGHPSNLSEEDRDYID